MRLALIAALQLLPARQRAVLILRDVLAWPAAEVAELLGSTTVAVKSTLQRARALIDRLAPIEDQLVEPAESELRALLDQYMSAFENADMAALMRLLRTDAELEMPPFSAWFSGRDTVGRFVGTHIFGPAGQLRMVPTGANSSPRSRRTGAAMTVYTGRTPSTRSPPPRAGSRASSRSSTRASSRVSACPRHTPPPRTSRVERARRHG